MTGDLGSRLRSARQRRGLTQEQLADGVVTASFLSLVESGKREPSPEVAQRLAARLGMTLAELRDYDDLEPVRRLRAAVARGQAQLAQDAEQALAALDPDLLQVAGDVRELALQFHHLRGLALSRACQTRAAISEFDLARGLASDDAHGRLEVVIELELVRCLLQRGDVGAATDLVERIWRGTPEEMAGSLLHCGLSVARAQVLQARGDHAAAVDLADRVRNALAEQEPDRSVVTRLLAASTARERANDSPAAMVLAQEAAQVAEHGCDPLEVARIRRDLAGIYLDSAPADVEAAAGQLELARTDVGACALLDGRIALARGEADIALRCALEAASSAEVSGDRLLALEAHLLAARATVGDLAASRLHVSRAEAILEQVEASRTTALHWRLLADAHAGQGHLEEAAALYRRALADAGVAGVPQPSMHPAGAAAPQS